MSFKIIVPAALGMIVGAAMVGQVFRNAHKAKVIILGIAAASLSLIGIGTIRYLNPVPFYTWLVIGLTFLLGLSNALVGVSAQTLLQEHSSDEERGKIFGTLNMMMNLAAALPVLLAGCLGLLVAALAIFFQKTRIGRALRAVADDHAAAQSVGIPLNQIWFIVWLVAGLVALAAGAVWGSKLGVQFSLSLLALKALPVLILGGFESVPGAIVGGLIIGSLEKLAEVYLGPYIGGGIEGWFAYVMPHGQAFVKRFASSATEVYPEIAGLTLCFWYPPAMWVPACELEPHGPRKTIAPGASVSFTEDWYLLPHKFPATGEQIDLEKLAAQVERAMKN